MITVLSISPQVCPGKTAACFLRRTSTKNGLTLPDVPAPGNQLAQMCPIESSVMRVKSEGGGKGGGGR